MNASELERLELVIDTAGVSRRIELLLPIGVRPRQLSVRTLLLGILLVAAACRPAHLRRVHQALTALPEAQQRRLGIIAHWRDGPHLLTYRQVERTFGLVVSKLANDTPDGTPSELLSQVLDQLLEASITVLGEPATSSYAVDWTDQETWSRPPPKRDAKRDDPKPNPDNDGDHEPTADPKQPTPDNDGDGDGEDDQRCADPEAAWGHRRGNHPGQKDEAFYGYYLQAATTVKDEHGPEVPELARRMLLTSCHVDPPPAFVPVLERMANDNITIADVLADSGYAYRVAENWALPIRALGAELIQDLHPNDRGPNGTHMGATCANGNLYCPATPTTLLQTQPLARGASAEHTAKHDQQCAELARYKLWFASDFATEVPWFFNLILGGFRGPGPGGRNDGRRQAAPTPAVDAGGEVGDLFGGDLAGDLAGRRGAEVRGGRERDHPLAGVGEGRGVGRVRVGEARPGGLARAGGAGGRPSGERSAVGGAEGDGSGVDVVPGKATLGLFGPVPARVSAEVKFELLGLIDQAVADGWAHARACRVLDLPDSRAHHWRQRLRETGTLEDGRPGGGAVHGLLAWEEQAILDLIEQWGPVDRSHRKLAHRGSYTDTVFVSPSTLLRVALKHRIRLLGERFRPRPPKLPFPEISWEKNRIWIWDATHFTRAKRVAYAIVDVVTRYWIGYLLSSEQTHTQVQLLFARALEDQGLLGPDGLPLRDDDEDGPILVAWSDNGAEMTAIDTRQFMALMAIAQHHGRPGTPTDQAHVESFFSHLKGDWPNLLAITDPGALDTELARIRGQYNTVRLHASIGYVTPEDEHHGRGPGIRRARIAGMRRAHTERIKQNRANKK